MKMRNQKGFTLIELLIVVAIIGIIAAIAIPGLLRARMSGNEASAIGSLRTINTSQVAFSSSCGGNFYAPSLVWLATPPAAGGQRFIAADMGADPVIKSGYTILLTPGPAPVPVPPPACNTAAPVTAYFVSGDPTNPGTTGVRTFGTDQGGTIWQDQTGATFGGGPLPAAPTNDRRPIQ